MSYPFFNQTIKTRQAVIHGNYKIGRIAFSPNKNKMLVALERDRWR
jgi:hypothetical protein